jgi:hypothetical protein
MVTKRDTAKISKSVDSKSVVSKQEKASSITLNRKAELIGDMPSVLDLRDIKLKHKGEIRITDDDLIEYIHLPSGEFSNVVIADLPNLKEIHAHGLGPTWMECQNLPNLKTLVIDGGARWLSVEQAGVLSSIDVGKCEQLGYLSIQHAPMLRSLNIEECRLLPHVQGLSTEEQDRLGVTRQMETVQAESKRDGSVYPRMTCTDIQLVLGKIKKAERLLKKQFPIDGEEIDAPNVSSQTYSYRLLQPGETVYTGGTGESYAYAFEVTTDETKGKKTVTNVLDERGIHEPEAAIGQALRRVTSGLGLARDAAPTEDQLLTYLNLLLSASGSDPMAWTSTDDGALRLALAANPLMSTDALAKLANDPDPAIRLAVAQNPAAELDVRRAVLHGLITERDVTTRLSIARSTATATEDLETLSGDSDVETLCAVAINPVTPSSLRAAVLEALSNCGESSGELLVARSPDAPKHLFPALLGSTDQQVLVAISENIGVPDSVRSAALEKLADSDEPNVKLSVAKNKLTPSAVLDSLSKASDSKLLGAIAENPSTPAEALGLLAQSKEWFVRCGVAGNPSAPPFSLLILAKDKDAVGGEYIRKSVAGNVNTPTTAFILLAKDKDWQIRLAVAQNAATPEDVLVNLATDKEYSVREHVARNMNAPSSALEVLSIDKHDNIKVCVAKNIRSSSDTLTRLASDRYIATRREVASNPATSRSVRQMLLNDAEQQVRTAAEKSLNTGADVL